MKQEVASLENIDLYNACVFGAYSLLDDPTAYTKMRTEILKRKIREYTAELREVEYFIDEIPDCQIRRIFHKRYIQGKKWLAIALDMRYSGEQGPRMVHDRFLERLSTM